MTKFNIVVVFLIIMFVVNENLTNGIYKIKYQNLYLNFNNKNNKFYFSGKSTLSKTSFFRIYNDLNNSFYLIESVNSKKKFFLSQNKISVITQFNT